MNGAFLTRLGAWLCALAILVPVGCAYRNDDLESNEDIIEIRMTFKNQVNAERFYYYLVFNFEADPQFIPLVDLDAFQIRPRTTPVVKGRIGENWDIFFLYGHPGDLSTPLPVNFYKGFAGNDPLIEGRPLRRDPTGALYADLVPTRAFDSSNVEYLSARITNGAVNSDDPNSVRTANTIEYRFLAKDFPNAPFTLPQSPKAKLAMFVTNQGIDELANPDDLIDDCVIYDRFLSRVITIDFSQKLRWNEQEDPQEEIEEERLPRNPPLNGPFEAADLTNWSVELVRR